MFHSYAILMGYVKVFSSHMIKEIEIDFIWNGGLGWNRSLFLRYHEEEMKKIMVNLEVWEGLVKKKIYTFQVFNPPWNGRIGSEKFISCLILL